MATSLFIARLMGPVLIASAIGLLLNQERYRSMIAEIEKNAVLLFMTGVMALVLGLTLVQVHNVWAADWRVVITLFGWMSVVAGIFRVILPSLVIRMGKSFMENSVLLFVAMVIHLVLGGWLTVVGYLL